MVIVSTLIIRVSSLEPFMETAKSGVGVATRWDGLRYILKQCEELDGCSESGRLRSKSFILRIEMAKKDSADYRLDFS